MIHVEGSLSPRLPHTQVNEPEAPPGWIMAMTGPQPAEWRRCEIWQCYSHADAYAGDANFFIHEWGIRGRSGQLSAVTCATPLFVGDYHYSRPASVVGTIAEQVPGSAFIIAHGRGHSAAVEKPGKLQPHLLAILRSAR